MRKLTSLAVAVLAGLSTGALAANLTVGQKGRAFGPDSVAIKKGTTLTFVNDDTVPHNIFSTSKGNEFNLGSQSPGASTDVTFNTVGETLVMCAIHPRMKLTLTVTD